MVYWVPLFHVIESCHREVCHKNFCLDIIFSILVFIWYLTAPLPPFDNYVDDNLSPLILISLLIQFLPEGHQEPCSDTDT